jgi:hypothetical protein
MKVLAVLLCFLVLSRAQEGRRLVYVGTLTGDPVSYVRNLNLVSRLPVAVTCTCPSSRREGLEPCLETCLKRFEGKARSLLLNRCDDIPTPASLVLYGVGDLRLEAFGTSLLLRRGDITALYPAVGFVLYGTGFCGTLGEE